MDIQPDLPQVRRPGGRRRLTALGFALLGLNSTITACGSSGETAADNSAAEASATPSADASASASSPTTAGATSSASPSTASNQDTARLLGPDELPGFNDTWTWREKATGAQDQPLGPCGRVTAEGLGAESAVQRTFEPNGGEGSGSATQIVARFSDAKAVRRALSVLRTRHDRCESTLKSDYGFVKVDPIRTVQVDTGSAWNYLTTYAPADADSGTFDEFGVLTEGTRVDIVRMRIDSYDYVYEPGSTPVAQTLTVLAERAD